MFKKSVIFAAVAFIVLVIVSVVSSLVMHTEKPSVVDSHIVVQSTPAPKVSPSVVPTKEQTVEELVETCLGHFDDPRCADLPVGHLGELSLIHYSAIQTLNGDCYGLVFNPNNGGFLYKGGSYVQLVLGDMRLIRNVVVTTSQPEGSAYGSTLFQPAAMQDWEYKCGTAEAATAVGQEFLKVGCWFDSTVEMHTMREFDDFLSSADTKTLCAK